MNAYLTQIRRANEAYLTWHVARADGGADCGEARGNQGSALDEFPVASCKSALHVRVPVLLFACSFECKTFSNAFLTGGEDR